jgi:hypothetical protein
MLLQYIPGICVQVKISRQIAHQPEEDEEEGLSRPFEFAFPFPITTTTLAKTFDCYDILAVQISGWINEGGVPYPGGAVKYLVQ